MAPHPFTFYPFRQNQFNLYDRGWLSQFFQIHKMKTAEKSLHFGSGTKKIKLFTK